MTRGRQVLARTAGAVARLTACDDPDVLMGLALELLEETAGIAHALLLLLDEREQSLYAVRARGYPDGGAGAEVRVGEGFIGAAAKSRRPIRVGSVSVMLNYQRTIRMQTVLAGEAVGREIPLPGLPRVESVLAMPILVRGDLVGVLAAESERMTAFDAETEHAVQIVAGVVGQQLALLGALSVSEPEETEAPAAAPAPVPSGAVREVVFHELDDSVFVDHEYVIKGVAGRILVKLLREHAGGRQEFSNRELRVDRWLQLPAVKDNLESRLVLLRQRLEEKPFGIRLERTGRGRFRVVVDGAVRVVVRAER